MLMMVFSCTNILVYIHILNAEDGIFLHQYSSSHSYPKLNVASILVDESGYT